MPRLFLAAVVLAACSQGPAPTGARRSPAMEPCGTEMCSASEVCYYDGRQAGSISNPSCKLAPAACGLDVTCECLVNQVRMTLCDDTGGVTEVTLYP